MAKTRKATETPYPEKYPRVFISWSGERSRHMAKALREWLPDVIQTIDIWMSEEDIEPGMRWASELSERLNQCEFGILCVTPENIDSPWLLFEAGCLAKSVSTSRVIPYRLDLSASGIGFPLAQFQNVGADKEGTNKLLHAINRANVNPMKDDRLNRLFGKWWPELYSHIETIGNIPRPVPAPGSSTRGPAINPCYDLDLKGIDGTFKVANVVKQMTIVIVVGDGMVSELLDRVAAGLLRDEISRHSKGDPFKRAIIIGYSRWKTETWLHANPTIAIGGEAANKLSGEILQACKALGKDKWPAGPGGSAAFVPAVPASHGSGTSPAASPTGPRVALWGGKAAETRSAVEHYVQRPEGLQEFLNDYAGWK